MRPSTRIAKIDKCKRKIETKNPKNPKVGTDVEYEYGFMSEAAKIALKGPVRLARFESHLLHLRGLAARTVESTEIIAAALGLSEVAASPLPLSGAQADKLFERAFEYLEKPWASMSRSSRRLDWATSSCILLEDLDMISSLQGALGAGRIGIGNLGISSLQGARIPNSEIPSVSLKFPIPRLLLESGNFNVMEFRGG